jgi:hypothetical protein
MRRPKATKNDQKRGRPKRCPIRRSKATKNDQKRNDAQNDAQEQDDSLSLIRISTTAQMARSLAYRDGSMAHLLAYRRRLKWLAYRRRLKWLARSHIASASASASASTSFRSAQSELPGNQRVLSQRIGHKQHPRARSISRPSLNQAQ